MDHGKVTITGDVDPHALIKKLSKAGKHAHVISPKPFLSPPPAKKPAATIVPSGAGKIQSQNHNQTTQHDHKMKPDQMQELLKKLGDLKAPSLNRQKPVQISIPKDHDNHDDDDDDDDDDGDDDFESWDDESSMDEEDSEDDPKSMKSKDKVNDKSEKVGTVNPYAPAMEQQQMWMNDQKRMKSTDTVSDKGVKGGAVNPYVAAMMQQQKMRMNGEVLSSKQKVHPTVISHGAAAESRQGYPAVISHVAGPPPADYMHMFSDDNAEGCRIM